MIDLEPEQLAEVRRILRDQVPECEVRAYGSRVTGRASRFSDLDLALLDPTGKMTWQRLEGLKETLSLSDLPIMVDVQVWAGIDQSFRQIILERYEVVQPLPRPETR